MKVNMEDIADAAPGYGLDDVCEIRALREVLGAERIGLTRYRMRPGRRLGLAHRHDEAEELYVVVSGTGRFRAGEEIFAIATGDVVRCPPEAMREWEAGPSGLDLIAFGTHVEGDAHVERGWWVDSA